MDVRCIRRASRALLTASALITVSVACSTILGDFPEGRLGDEPPKADAGLDSATDDASSNPLPEGTICVIPNGVIINLLGDGPDLFWLRGPPPPESEGFAVEACSKNGGPVRHVAEVPSAPEGLAVSDKYVFWSINQLQEDLGSIWRAERSYGEPPTSAWLKGDYPGPLHVANGTLYFGHRPDEIVLVSPDSGAITKRYPNAGNAGSVVASPTTAYWSNRDTNTIRMITNFGTAADFATGLPSLPSFLAFDKGAVLWATFEASGANISSKCETGCTVTPIVNQPKGFQSFAARNGSLYWTANEDGGGVVRACADRTKCQAPELLFKTDVEVSRIVVDDADVYVAAKRGNDTYIIKHSRELPAR